MTKIPAPLLLLMFLAVLLTGCGGPNIVSVGLKIEVAHIERETDGSTQVTWRIVNPNIVSYLLAESSHQITLNGTLIGRIAQHSPVGLPAQNNTEITTALTSAGPAAERAIAEAAKAGSASYQVESAMVIRLFDDQLDRSKLSNSGTVKVSAK